MGLNFYGMKYEMDKSGKLTKQPEPILGSQLIDLIKDQELIVQYDQRSEEHVFLKTSDKTLIYYPTLYSLEKRITLANELNTGLSIWELGQGHTFFFDLL
jgi:chitinase domain-containing protein 1